MGRRSGNNAFYKLDGTVPRFALHGYLLFDSATMPSHQQGVCEEVRSDFGPDSVGVRLKFGGGTEFGPEPDPTSALRYILDPGCLAYDFEQIVW